VETPAIAFEGGSRMHMIVGSRKELSYALENALVNRNRVRSKSLTERYSTMQIRSNNVKRLLKANQRGIVLPMILIFLLGFTILD
jgi:hypothetical protein